MQACSLCVCLINQGVIPRALLNHARLVFTYMHDKYTLEVVKEKAPWRQRTATKRGAESIQSYWRPVDKWQAAVLIWSVPSSASRRAENAAWMARRFPTLSPARTRRMMPLRFICSFVRARRRQHLWQPWRLVGEKIYTYALQVSFFTSSFFFIPSKCSSTPETFECDVWYVCTFISFASDK